MPMQTKGVIKRFHKMDESLADELTSIVYGGKGHLNPELLENLTKRVDNIDTTFAKELHALKVNPHFFLGYDGRYYYESMYKQVHEEMHTQIIERITPNAEAIMGKKPSNLFAEFNGAVIEKRKAALLYEAASELSYLEELRKLLLEIKDGRYIDVAKNKADIEAIDRTIKFPADNKYLISQNNNSSFFEKFTELKSRYSSMSDEDYFDVVLKDGAGIEDYRKHLDASGLETLYLGYLPKYNVLQLDRESIRLYQGWKMESSLRQDKVYQLREEIGELEKSMILKNKSSKSRRF